MGCDIHAYAERRDGAKWVPVATPRQWGWCDFRSYSVFGWLAGVRNYSEVEPAFAFRGLPADVSESTRSEYAEHDLDYHSASWATLDELEGVDYDALVNDRRVIRKTGPRSWNGGCTGAPEEGEKKTLREFLGDCWFDELAEMRERGAERLVFWFDN